MVIMLVVHWFGEKLAVLNVFESDSTDIEIVRRERLSTRVYMCLIAVIIAALIIYTGFRVRTNTVTVLYPSRTQFEYLFDHYTPTLRCYCSKVAIPYGTFVQVKVIFHQVCSSSFISLEWIQSVYAANVTYVWPMDIRTTFSAFWQLVAAFCQNLQDVVAATVVDYNVSTLVSPQVMSLVELSIRAETSLQFTLVSAQAAFARNLRTIRNIISNEQFVSGLATNAYLQFSDSETSSDPQASPVINTFDGCSCANTDGCPKLSGFFEFDMWDTKGMYDNINANISVPGILFDCYPLNAVLGSTLECYYISTCLALIHSTLNATPLSLPTSTRFQMNTTIQTLLDELFIDQIQAQTSFSLYYSQCNPSFCTYLHSRRFDLLFMLTTMVTAFGGLVIVLKLIAPLIVKAALALYHRYRRERTLDRPINSYRIYGRNVMLFVHSIPNRLREWWLNLNIFRIHSHEPRIIYRQRIASRCYVICLFVSIVILGVYNLFSVQVQSITVTNPSQSTYTSLYQSYSDSLKCECSELSMTYGDFFEIMPSMHQICSSEFISPHWYNRLLKGNFSTLYSFSNSQAISSSYFSLLASFCALANSTIIDSLRIFRATQFINKEVLPQWQFTERTQLLIDTFTNTTLSEFTRMFTLIRNATTVNQFVTGFNLNGYIYVKSNGQVLMMSRSLAVIDFDHPYQSVSACSCAGDTSQCGGPIVVLLNSSIYSYYLPPGLFYGCLKMDGALFSTLECWFTPSCLAGIHESLAGTGIEDMLDITPLNISLPSQFQPNTSMDGLMSKLLLEYWIINISYEKFYHICAPKVCVYTKKEQYDIFFTILTIIAIYGGLSKGLRILVPWIIRLALCLYWKYNGTNHQQNGADISQPNRLHKKLWLKFLLLNWFSNRSSTADTASRERRSTKLYFILFLISITILITYTSLIKRTHTEYVMNPSIQDHEQLQTLYGDILQCPCSKIAIPRRSFITRMNATLHPICTSNFIKGTRWIYWLSGSEIHITWVPSYDFRQWGSAFFVWIGAFCKLSASTISNAITNFESTSLVTIQPMNYNEFQSQTNLEIDQFLENTRTTFIQTLKLYRDMVQGSALMSLFATNWLPVVKQRYNVSQAALRTKPIIYNSSCSCAISRTCMEPAGIYAWNETLLYTIDGVMHGCFLLESYLASSLSCFYSNSCLVSFFSAMVLGSPDREHTPWCEPNFCPKFPPLDSSLLRHFSVNDTFTTIVNELFIDVWSTNTSYESYFKECSPRYCAYSVVNRFEFLYVLTTFLSFYTAISLILYIVIPCIVRIALFLKQRMRVGPTTVVLNA